jgi:uncharacterized flavoprotein (TIGR03862 family)
MCISLHNVVIIGAGPAGLMAADVLSSSGIGVTIYDAMPSAGRKFLLAGKGGMNITHAEPYAQFLARYGARRQELEPILNAFPPDALRSWLADLGINTFIGSSGRVFPESMKAAPLLRTWLQRLRQAGVRFHMRHRWLGWGGQDELIFSLESEQVMLSAKYVILALGGGSWPNLGSTGFWVQILASAGIDVKPLLPANCGFEVGWRDEFRQRYAGHPLKKVALCIQNTNADDRKPVGEIMLSYYGMEGGLIYLFSSVLREQITQTGFARIYLDLLPDTSLPEVIQRLSLPRNKMSWANHLRKRLGLSAAKCALLREIIPELNAEKTSELASMIKSLPIDLHAARPLAEAISSAGGVSFSELDEHLMLRAMPGWFCAGEMLDWEAPTGGYLLNACLASGRAAGMGMLSWLDQQAN